MRYLLDTNIISEAIKKPNGKIARKLSRQKPNSFGISAITACELHFGIENNPSEKVSTQIHRMLRSVPVLDFPSEAAKIYGILRADLKRKGQLISGNDMLIAAHSIHSRLTLVSDNAKEFEHIPGLKLENWIRE